MIEYILRLVASRTHTVHSVLFSGPHRGFEELYIHIMPNKDSKGLQVTWSSLPRKDQLLVLCLVRLSEPVVRLSIVSYIYYQLRSLDSSLSSPEIIKQAAWLQTVFMMSQCASSWFLGRLADSPRGGRKLVTMVSLLGSCKSRSATTWELHCYELCLRINIYIVITCAAFGFVQNFRQAVLLRIFEGLTNGNVAMVRTMVSEVVVEKR